MSVTLFVSAMFIKRYN